MRVLHFLPVYVPAYQYGGPILSVSRLCEALASAGIQVHVITTNAGLPNIPSETLGRPVNVGGVTVTYFKVDTQNGPIFSTSLLHALPNLLQSADVLHISSVWQPLGIPIQRLAHKYNVPVIQTLRGALGPYSLRHRWWKKIPYFLLRELPLLQKASAIHCTTHMEQRELRKFRLRAPVSVINNPIDVAQYSCQPKIAYEWRIKHNIPVDEPLFFVAGRIHHKKGLDLLPLVFSKFKERSWNLLFIGDDDDGSLKSLRRRFSFHGLSARCHWFPSISSSELVGPYNAADWLILPSRHENFGNVVIEALACGCGTLISHNVGVAESLLSCPGVHVSKRSSKSFVAQVELALRSSRPGTLSETWVKREFSSTAIADQALSLYQYLVSHDKSGSNCSSGLNP